MGRPKGSNNQKPLISYPRICDCGYAANNPSMWSYHTKTHEPLPSGRLCDFGCGDFAKARNTGGRYTCDVAGNGNRCPSMVAEIRKRVTRDWVGANKRKEDATRSLLTTSFTDAAKTKSKETKRRNLIAQDNTKDRRQYNRQIHSISQGTLRQHPNLVNPLGLPIGKTTNHLDHMVSKHVGYLLGIPAEYMGSHYNLEVIPQSQNNSKLSKCSKHPLQLLSDCHAPAQIVESVQLKLAQLGDSFERLVPSRS